MKTNSSFLNKALALSALVAPAALAASLGQIDTFEDGTTQGWLVGALGALHPAPPSNVPSGGPAGLDDNYLLLTSVGGGGPGSRLSVLNLGQQWAGDYVAAGVGAIRMSVINLGLTDLDLRLLLADPLAGPPANLAFSLAPVHVPFASGWVTATFPLNPTDLLAGLGDVETALRNTTELRLYHSTGDQFPGESITASLGVDNITAVPEPAVVGLVAGVAMLGFAAVRRFQADSGSA